jgi:RNA polymerase sigma factor (sigma-70 family)
MATESFEEWIHRVRACDQQAAGALVEQFQPFVRREVQRHGSLKLLRRLLDPDDVAQAVFFSFFSELQQGEYELASAAQLGALLASIARHQVASSARQQLRRRRDMRRNLQSSQQEIESLPDEAPLPDELLADLESLELLRAQLTVEERGLADLRREGCSWKAIAAQLGGTPQARRMQLFRAVERAALQIGIVE